MDVHGAIEVIDEAIEAIDVHADAYEYAMRVENDEPHWARANAIEQETVLPKLELARQIAARMGVSAAPFTANPDKRAYNMQPYGRHRAVLLVLRTRLSESERMEAILGPAGPKLSSASFHPIVWHAAADLFDDGHFRQAVQSAGQGLESHLQTLNGPSLSGKSLARLFGSPGEGVRMHFGFLDPNGETYSGARDGTSSLIRGAMIAVRNLVSHPEWPDPTEDEALEMLAVLSYVAHLVDRASPMD